MTTLSPEEMESLREQIAKPLTPTSPSHALVRDADAAGGLARRIDDAAPAVRDAVENVLSSRTHRAWTVKGQPVRTERVMNLVAAIPLPSMGSCIDGPLVIIDQETAQRFVSLLLGFDQNAPSSDTLGALDRQVLVRLLKGLADEVAAALVSFGARVAKPAGVEHGWRGVAERLSGSFAVVPLDIEEPICARIDVVVPLSCWDASALAENATDSLGTNIENIDVDVHVELGSLSLALGTLTGLQPNAVLSLQNTETTPLIVYVQGERRFVGRPQATADGRVTVTIIDNHQHSQV